MNYYKGESGETKSSVFGVNINELLQEMCKNYYKGESGETKELCVRITKEKETKFSELLQEMCKITKEKVGKLNFQL